MSINYHANQYEQAFNTKRMQSWEFPIPASRRPQPREGFSQIRANDRGHLLPGAPRSRASPWGAFVGTWDMPTKLPGNHYLNPTARSERVTLRFEAEKEAADEVLCGALKQTKAYAPVGTDILETSLPEQHIIKKDQEKPETLTNVGWHTTLTDVIKGSDSRTRMADLAARESAHNPLDWPLHESNSPKSARSSSPKSGSPVAASGGSSTTQISSGRQGELRDTQAEGQDDTVTTPVDWPIAKSPQPLGK